MDGQWRGLLIDWGGVLTTDIFAAFNGFCAREGLPAGAVAARFRDDPGARRLLIGLEDGSLPPAGFERGFAELLGVPADRLIERMMADLRPDDAMRAGVRRLRAAGVPVGLISNSWGTGMYHPEHLTDLFDAVVISGEVGIRKPAPAIYRLGTDALGLSPAACVFVDDLAGNLKPAHELGMATVLHRDAGSTLARLGALLGVPAS